MKFVFCMLSFWVTVPSLVYAQSIPTTATARVKIERVEMPGSGHSTVLCDVTKPVAIANWLDGSRTQPEVTNVQCKTTLNGVPKIANVDISVLLTVYAVFNQPISVRRIYATLSYGTGAFPTSEDPANFYRSEVFESRDLNLSSALISMSPHGSTSIDHDGAHPSSPEYIVAEIEVSNP